MLNYSSKLFVDYNFKINNHFYQFLKPIFFLIEIFLEKKNSTYFYEICIKKIKFNSLYN